MSMMPTKEERQQQEIKRLKAENQMLKTIMSKMSEKTSCTCGIDTKECVTAEEWMKCSVHNRSFKKGEL